MSDGWRHTPSPLEEHLTSSPNGLLTHYTGEEAFNGIVRNKEIWMTNALYLNDSQELRWAFRTLALRIKESLEAYQKELEADETYFERNVQNLHALKAKIAEHKGDNSSLQKLREKEEILEHDVRSDGERIGSHDYLRDTSWKLGGFTDVSRILETLTTDPSSLGVEVYIASFSTKQDHLSQWRGYCPQGGYALMFDYNDLKGTIREQNFIFGKCLYDSYQQSNDEEKIKDLVEAVVRKIAPLGYDSAAFSPPGIQQEIVRHVAAISPFIKHGGFYEEDEWRLVCVETEQQTDCVREVHFGPQNKPYVKFNLDNYSFEKLRVMVGPMLNQDKAGVSAKEFLARQLTLSFDKAAEQVQLSEIPYRTQALAHKE